MGWPMMRCRRLRVAMIFAALLAGTTIDAQAPEPPSVRSSFVQARDGTRLAVDVHMPPTRAPARLPAILVMTRYGRGAALSQSAIGAFLEGGFAVVTADMRGSGASFGSVVSIFSDEERSDIGRLTRWIVEQPWSNGRIVTTGASHDGNLAALAIGARGVVGAIPRFIDQDTYRHLAVPGGVRNEHLLRAWGELTHALDIAEPCLVLASNCAQLSHLVPVGEDPGYQLLRSALVEHQRNWHPYRDSSGYAFSDDRVPEGRLLASGFLSSQANQAALRTPELIWASWLDASTADSAIERFLARREAPIELVIGAWAHGGGVNLDEFAPTRPDADPAMGGDFLAFASAAANGSPRLGRRIRYYTMGAGSWRETPVWPPSGMSPTSWWLAADHALATEAPAGPDQADRHAVDFRATSGPTNRWATQIGGGPVAYPARAVADRALLTYTGSPLARALEISGSPMLEIWLSSTHADGAIFAYLEAVAPDGRVLYLTEGQRRLGFRRESFRRSDFSPLTPGVPIHLSIPLLATSVLIPAGWRIRLALSGHDEGTFARYPAEGSPVLSILRGAERSRLILPQAWRERQ